MKKAITRSKIRRSLKISLGRSNTGKLQPLDDLWNAYRLALSDFLNRLFDGEPADESFLKGYNSLLSYRYKQCAKRQAMKLFKTWCRRRGKKSKPTLRNPSMTLDYRFIEVQEGRNSFDFWIKVASLEKGHPVLIPAKSYEYLNRYLREWRVVAGGQLVRQQERWFLILTFEKGMASKTEGVVKAVDIGYRKLGVTSEGQVVGERLPELIEKADRKQNYSRGYYKAKREIKRYVNHELKKLFHDGLRVLVVEDLKRLKDGERGKWSKGVNRKFGFWIYGHALRRIREVAEVGGVHCRSVPPAGTSQTCPLCGHSEKLNRQGERFRCRRCGLRSRC